MLFQPSTMEWFTAGAHPHREKLFGVRRKTLFKFASVFKRHRLLRRIIWCKYIRGLTGPIQTETWSQEQVTINIVLKSCHFTGHNHLDLSFTAVLPPPSPTPPFFLSFSASFSLSGFCWCLLWLSLMLIKPSCWNCINLYVVSRLEVKLCRISFVFSTIAFSF